MALKGRNAIVIAPSPAGLATTTRTVELMRAELDKIGAPADLVQVLPPPADKASTRALMARLRPRGGHRLAEQRPRGLPERDPGDRGRRGQRPGDRRRERGPRRGGGEDREVQVLRQRHLVLVGELGGHPRRRVRRGPRRPRARWRTPRERGGEGGDPRHALGERQAQPGGHREGRSRVRRRVRPRGAGGPTRSSSW